MTSPAAVVGLTYDGVDLQDSDLQLFLTITSGLWETASVRGVDTVVPGLAGRYEQDRINDVLPIVLDGFCRADPAEGDLAAAHASYVIKKRATRTLFRSNRDRALLIATLEDGTALQISARPMATSWPEHVPGFFSDLSVQLEGFDDWVLVS